MTKRVSAVQKKSWVQGSLFEPATVVLVKATPEGRDAPRVNYVRVTRDGAVALSYAQSRLIAAQVTSGLAAAFGKLEPKRQAELRSLLSQPRRSLKLAG